MEHLAARGLAPRLARVPSQLDANALFRLDVDDKIWVDDGFWETEDGKLPPLWLSDEGVREAIPSMLERDRVLEEQERLGVEVKAMVNWLNDEVVLLKQARILAAGNFITLNIAFSC